MLDDLSKMSVAVLCTRTIDENWKAGWDEINRRCSLTERERLRLAEAECVAGRRLIASNGRGPRIGHHDMDVIVYEQARAARDAANRGTA